MVGLAQSVDGPRLFDKESPVATHKKKAQQVLEFLWVAWGGGFFGWGFSRTQSSALVICRCYML